MPARHIRADLRPPGISPTDWARRARLLSPDQIEDVPEVIAQQKRIERCYQRAQNGIYWFTKFYIAVTEGVQGELAAGGLSPGAADFLRRLDISFYGYYCNALCESDAQDPVRIAWDPLLDRFQNPRTHPMVFALMGINAHITCDLPQAILDTLLRVGYRRFPSRGGEAGKVFFDLNRILHRVALSSLRKDFVHGLPGLLHRLYPRTLEDAADRYIQFVREQAWLQAEKLWAVYWEGRSGAKEAPGAADPGRESPALIDVRELLALQARAFGDCIFRELPLRPDLTLSDLAAWIGQALTRGLAAASSFSRPAVSPGSGDRPPDLKPR